MVLKFRGGLREISKTNNGNHRTYTTQKIKIAEITSHSHSCVTKCCQLTKRDMALKRHFPNDKICHLLCSKRIGEVIYVSGSCIVAGHAIFYRDFIMLRVVVK